MFENDKIGTFYLVPKECMDELIETVRDLKDIQEKMDKQHRIDTLGDFIPEERAMELLNRGKTWFWQKRKNCELEGKKAAGRWYYRMRDIQDYIENGK